MNTEYLRKFHDDFLDADGLPSVSKLKSLDWKLLLFSDNNLLDEYGDVADQLALFFAKYKGAVRALNFDYAFSSGSNVDYCRLLEYREIYEADKFKFTSIIDGGYINLLIESSDNFIFLVHQSEEICIFCGPSQSVSAFKQHFSKYTDFFILENYHLDLIRRYGTLFENDT